MDHFKWFKQIEDNLFELAMEAGEFSPPGYLLTLSREGYVLINETEEVERDGELCDLYYFKHVK
jgi:hypothetical protein